MAARPTYTVTLRTIQYPTSILPEGRQLTLSIQSISTSVTGEGSTTTIISGVRPRTKSMLPILQAIQSAFSTEAGG